MVRLGFLAPTAKAHYESDWSPTLVPNLLYDALYSDAWSPGATSGLQILDARLV